MKKSPLIYHIHCVGCLVNNDSLVQTVRSILSLELAGLILNIDYTVCYCQYFSAVIPDLDIRNQTIT